MNRINSDWFLTDLHCARFKTSFELILNLVRSESIRMNPRFEWFGLNKNESNQVGLIFNRFALSYIQNVFWIGSTDSGMARIRSNKIIFRNFQQEDLIYIPSIIFNFSSLFPILSNCRHCLSDFIYQYKWNNMHFGLFHGILSKPE